MNRKVVVTGGASGIGSAVVAAFAANGDETVVLDRSPRDQAVGGAVAKQWIECDLSDRSSIDQAVREIGGDVDVVCNIAGLSGVSPVNTVMAVNFLAVRHLTDSLAPVIKLGGSVVTLASTAGWRWRDAIEDLTQLTATDSWGGALRWSTDALTTGYEAYERSKQAVIVWTSIAAQQYLGRFRVNCVSPGPVETPLLADFYASMGHDELDPLTARGGGRNGTPEEIASVVRFLADPASSWINGTDIVVDAGAEMAEELAAKGALPRL